MNEQRFLEWIAERPDDDSLKQVFADWLLEQGDPRGELIVLQLRDHAGQASAQDRARSAHLIRKFGARWLGPLAKVMGPSTYRFERGFLAAGSVGNGQGDAHVLLLKDDLRWATVRELRPDGHLGPEAFAALLGAPRMKSLERLELGRDTLDRLQGAEVAWRLRALRFKEPAIGSDDLRAIAALPGLTTVRRLELAIAVDLYGARELKRTLTRSALAERLTDAALLIEDGTLEAFAGWLFDNAELPESVESIEARGYGARFVLSRAEDGWSSLAVETGDDPSGARGLATAAAVLSQLRPLQVRAVEVRHLGSEPVQRTHLAALEAACRRLPSIEHLQLPKSGERGGLARTRTGP